MYLYAGTLPWLLLGAPPSRFESGFLIGACFAFQVNSSSASMCGTSAPMILLRRASRLRHVAKLPIRTSKAFVSGLFAATRPQVAVFGLPWGFVVGACFSYSHQTLSVAQLFLIFWCRFHIAPWCISSSHWRQTYHRVSVITQQQPCCFHQQTVSERISHRNIHGTQHSSCVLLKKIRPR